MAKRSRSIAVADMPVWHFPERLVRHGTRLLTQQCWYWGCDVRRSAGNLLLDYGFSRTRPPADVQGSSRYTYTLAPGQHLTLWSFGVCFGNNHYGDIYLDRFRSEPRLPAGLDVSAVWSSTQVSALARPNAADRPALAPLLAGLVAAIVAYEQTILATHGLAYREDCLAAWSRARLGLPAATLIDAWNDFGVACAQECEAI